MKCRDGRRLYRVPTLVVHRRLLIPVREMFPQSFKHLRLFACDPYDVALAKLERNIQRDRDDVRHLARTIPFDLQTLKERYERELRPILGNPDREDLTLRLWLEAIEEERRRQHMF